MGPRALHTLHEHERYFRRAAALWIYQWEKILQSHPSRSMGMGMLKGWNIRYDDFPLSLVLGWNTGIFQHSGFYRRMV